VKKLGFKTRAGLRSNLPGTIVLVFRLYFILESISPVLNERRATVISSHFLLNLFPLILQVAAALGKEFVQRLRTEVVCQRCLISQLATRHKHHIRSTV
jgi:hypothetical protein